MLDGLVQIRVGVIDPAGQGRPRLWIPGNDRLDGEIPGIDFGLSQSRRRTAANSGRSEEHTSELQSLMRNSYAVFRLKKKSPSNTTHTLNDRKTTTHKQRDK